MTFISFIFNFTRDLNNALALLGHKHKVACEVKNKGNYRHPINNYYFQIHMYISCVRKEQYSVPRPWCYYKSQQSIIFINGILVWLLKFEMYAKIHFSSSFYVYKVYESFFLSSSASFSSTA